MRASRTGASRSRASASIRSSWHLRLIKDGDRADRAFDGRDGLRLHGLTCGIRATLARNRAYLSPNSRCHPAARALPLASPQYANLRSRMSRKPVPAQSGERSRAELTFDKPQLLAAAVRRVRPATWSRSRTGSASISPRAATASGWRARPKQVALARDVLQDLYNRVAARRGCRSPGWSTRRSRWRPSRCSTASSRADGGRQRPPIMIRTRKKTIVPRTPAQAHYMRELIAQRHDLRARAGGHRQDLYRGGAGGVAADHRQRPAADPVAPRGRGGREARLPARRHEGEGRSLSAPALRRAPRLPARRAGRAPDRERARSRSRRSPSCAGARWPTRSSSSTRRRTPRRRR